MQFSEDENFRIFMSWEYLRLFTFKLVVRTLKRYRLCFVGVVLGWTQKNYLNKK